MKKQYYKHTNYKTLPSIGISKSEKFLLDLIEKNNLDVFGLKELERITSWRKIKLNNTLYSMKKKSLIINIKRNMYTSSENFQKNIFKIANSVASPSYISFWTALSFYGYTEQQVNAIQIVSTKQHKDLSINSHRIEITKFKSERFYGYKRIENFVIAEREKSIIDSFFCPKKCGGFDEVLKCFINSWNSLDKEKFVEYLIRFNDKSLVSRIGYIIYALNLDKKRELEISEKYKSSSFVLLNQENKKTNKYDKRWKIILNHDIMKKEEIK